MAERGFTLVETIIYTALSSIVLTAIFSFSIAVGEVKIKNSVIREVNSSSRLALRTISNLLRSAESVSAPAPRGSGTALNFLKNNIEFSIYQLGDRIAIEEDGDRKFLTSNKVVISNLSFVNHGEIAKDGISFSFSIASVDSTQVKYSYNKNLRTAVTLR